MNELRDQLVTMINNDRGLTPEHYAERLGMSRHAIIRLLTEDAECHGLVRDGFLTRRPGKVPPRWAKDLPVAEYGGDIPIPHARDIVMGTINTGNLAVDAKANLVMSEVRSFRTASLKQAEKLAPLVERDVENLGLRAANGDTKTELVESQRRTIQMLDAQLTEALIKLSAYRAKYGEITITQQQLRKPVHRPTASEGEGKTTH